MDRVRPLFVFIVLATVVGAAIIVASDDGESDWTMITNQHHIPYKLTQNGVLDVTGPTITGARGRRSIRSPARSCGRPRIHKPNRCPASRTLACGIWRR